MTTPAAPDTVNSVGATDDASKGGLFNSLNNTTLSTIEQAIATRATAAATSATNAKTSETNAAASATSAANTLDAFDDRYLGNKTSDPTVDNDGNALLTGALYFNTNDNVIKAYTGSAWSRIKPTTSHQTSIDAVNTDPFKTNINNVSGNANNINTVAGDTAEINALNGSGVLANIGIVAGQISPTNNIATVAGANSNISTITAGSVIADIGTVANIDTAVSNVSTISNAVTSVNNNKTNINTIATGQTGGNSNLANLNTIATGTTGGNANLAQINTVAVNTNNINTVAQADSNITALNGSGVIGNIGTVAGIHSDVTTVAGIESEIQAVAADATDIGAVAAKATEIGRLGTADAVADMNKLGTDAIVEDMDKLGTDANVIAMGHLGNTTVVGNMATLTAGNVLSEISTVAGVSSDVTSVATNISNVNTVAAIFEGTATYTVTVVNSGGNKFAINTGSGSTTAPALILVKGFTYTFDVSDNTNSGHPLAFLDASGNAYTTGVTVTGTAGQAGAKVVFTVPTTGTQPARYYCTAHGNAMGNTITTESNDIAEVLAISNEITTVSGIDSDVTAVAGKATEIGLLGVPAVITDMDILGTNPNVTAMGHLGTPANVTNMAALNGSGVIANIATVATNITNVNTFANTYFIGGSAPTGGTVGSGDLWYDTSSTQMKVHNGSSFVTFISTYDTDNLSEGSSNLYYTDTRADARITNAFSNAVSLGSTLAVGSNLVVSGGSNFTGNMFASGTLNVSSNFNVNTNKFNVVAPTGNTSIAGTLGVAGTTTLSGTTTLNNDVTFTGDNYNVVWDKSQNSLEFSDSARATFGTGRDFQLQFNGANGLIENYTGDLFISNFSNDQDIFIRSDNGNGGFTTYIKAEGSTGETQLYYYGSEKLATKSAGVDITGMLTVDSLLIDGGVIFTGANYSTQWDKANNALHFTDNAKATFGSGSDLKITHDASNSIIADEGTGSLFVRGSAIRIDDPNSDDYIVCTQDGSVDIYYDGIKKFETTSTGSKVTGDLETTADIELGHASDTTISRTSAGVVAIEGNTILTTGNSNTPTTTSSSSDADHVLVNDNGTMKKITPANLGVISNAASQGFAVAMAIAL